MCLHHVCQELGVHHSLLSWLRLLGLRWDDIEVLRRESAWRHYRRNLGTLLPSEVNNNFFFLSCSTVHIVVCQVLIHHGRASRFKRVCEGSDLRLYCSHACAWFHQWLSGFISLHDLIIKLELARVRNSNQTVVHVCRAPVPRKARLLLQDRTRLKGNCLMLVAAPRPTVGLERPLHSLILLCLRIGCRFGSSVHSLAKSELDGLLIRPLITFLIA